MLIARIRNVLSEETLKSEKEIISLIGPETF